jgi:hypothetical protein
MEHKQSKHTVWQITIAKKTVYDVTIITQQLNNPKPLLVRLKIMLPANKFEPQPF